MTVPSSAIDAISPFPDPASSSRTSFRQAGGNTSPPLLSTSSASSSASESEPYDTSSLHASLRRTRLERPRMGERQRSNSIIIPKGGDTYQKERPLYPPDDARAMSPRRSSVDLERLEKSARKSLKDQARTLQSSLAALAERIDEVKSDHDKLENENRFLQDYIGGLTRTMSKDGLGSSTAKKGKK